MLRLLRTSGKVNNTFLSINYIAYLIFEQQLQQLYLLTSQILGPCMYMITSVIDFGLGLHCAFFNL